MSGGGLWPAHTFHICTLQYPTFFLESSVVMEANEAWCIHSQKVPNKCMHSCLCHTLPRHLLSLTHSILHPLDGTESTFFVLTACLKMVTGGVMRHKVCTWCSHRTDLQQKRVQAWLPHLQQWELGRKTCLPLLSICWIPEERWVHEISEKHRRQFGIRIENFGCYSKFL